MPAAVIKLLLAIIGPEIVKKLGRKAVVTLLNQTAGKNGQATSETIKLAKYIASGGLDPDKIKSQIQKQENLENEAEAELLNKKTKRKEAEERLAENKYGRSTTEKLLEDTVVPLASAAAKTIGLGYNLKQGILPLALQGFASQGINNQAAQNAAGNFMLNPASGSLGLAKGVADLKGQTVQAGLNAVANIAENAASRQRVASEATAQRNWLRDLAASGEGQNQPGAFWDATGRTITAARETNKKFAGGSY